MSDSLSKSDSRFAELDYGARYSSPQYVPRSRQERGSLSISPKDNGIINEAVRNLFNSKPNTESTRSQQEEAFYQFRRDRARTMPSTIGGGRRFMASSFPMRQDSDDLTSRLRDLAIYRPHSPPTIPRAITKRHEPDDKYQVSHSLEKVRAAQAAKTVGSPISIQESDKALALFNSSANLGGKLSPVKSGSGCSVDLLDEDLIEPHSWPNQDDLHGSPWTYGSRDFSMASESYSPLISSYGHPYSAFPPLSTRPHDPYHEHAPQYMLQSSFSDARWHTPSRTGPSYGDPIEMMAKEHREMASRSEPRCTWSGHLPNRSHKNPTYSPKVFLGGVPWDITDAGLSEAFQHIGNIRVQRPGGEQRQAPSSGVAKAGYVYVVFEGDKHVKQLLQGCTHDYSAGGKWYFNISSKKMRQKEVQVIPWIIGDSNFVRCPSQRLDPSKTVFVGALHGMLTAEGLAHVMNDLFGGVAYVGIDTDKYKYPIGSGRVTFNNQRSYMKAVQAAFVDIKATTRFNKKVELGVEFCNSVVISRFAPNL